MRTRMHDGAQCTTQRHRNDEERHMSSMTGRARPGIVAAFALGCALAAAIATAQNSTSDEIAKYREALQDETPAELWEARGEDRWKQKRGPKAVSLKTCDLGLGPGVVKAAYTRLPRYFADADRVM